MGRRGSNSFRRNDGLRALRIAKDAGSPAGLEVVIKPDKSVVFRVLTERAASLLGVAPETETAAREWQREIEKLKAAKTTKAPKAKGR
jgi:hypothetical protein